MRIILALLLTYTAWATDIDVLRAAYVAQGCGAVFHWNMSTFQEIEWATPNVAVDTFAPTAASINFGAWMDLVQAAGCTYVNITTKHHDGFKLWPRAAYSISQTAWYAANGSPDLLGQFITAARARGLNIVLYYSIWDRTWEIANSVTAETGTAAYISMIESELTDLLTNYGAITAIWTDGWSWSAAPTTPGAAGGGVGGYTYIIPATIRAHIKGIQPDCLHIENNHNHPYNPATGDIEVYEWASTAGSEFPAGGNTRLSEVMTTMRWSYRWFYDAGSRHNADAQRSPRDLVNAIALINSLASTATVDFTPDKAGVIPTTQVESFQRIRSEARYTPNLAAGKSATSSTLYSGTATAALTDNVFLMGAASTIFSTETDATPWAEIDLGSAQKVGRVEIFGRNDKTDDPADGYAGRMRDLTVTLCTATPCTGANVLYTSPLLNPGNSAYGGAADYKSGPGQLTVTFLPVSARYIRVARTCEGACNTDNLASLAMMEVQAFMSNPLFPLTSPIKR